MSTEEKRGIVCVCMCGFYLTLNAFCVITQKKIEKCLINAFDNSDFAMKFFMLEKLNARLKYMVINMTISSYTWYDPNRSGDGTLNLDFQNWQGYASAYHWMCS